ncbi:MAG TPA: TetR/AcrR family transcriptional regulator C-terminal domain-containing protein [Micromonosporaceae bacterium]
MNQGIGMPRRAGRTSTASSASDPVAPPYQRIAAEIRRRIVTGDLAPGDRVPSARRITRDHSVAIATATRALRALREEGLVEAVPGIGTVVAGRAGTARPARGREPREAALVPDVDRLVRAAIAMADVDGLPGVSMRRLAAQFGVPTMSLYRHVRGKDELVMMMADAALAERPLPRVRPAGWRAQLELVARLQWDLYRRHPWLARVISITRPQLLPHGMAHTEWALRAVHGRGLTQDAMLHAAVTLFAFVRGTAMNLEAQLAAEQDTGMTDDEWIKAHEATFATVANRAPYPTLARLIGSDVDLSLDSLFEFGLRRMLDGYQVLLGD